MRDPFVVLELGVLDGPRGCQHGLLAAGLCHVHAASEGFMWPMWGCSILSRRSSAFSRHGAEAMAVVVKPLRGLLIERVKSKSVGFLYLNTHPHFLLANKSHSVQDLSRERTGSIQGLGFGPVSDVHGGSWAVHLFHWTFA